MIIRVESMEGLRLDNVTHFFVPLHPASPSAEFDTKLQYLLALYDTLTVGKTMIFVATRDGAGRLAAAMRAQGHHPSVITGAKEVAMEERVRVQEEFEKGITKVLICTDLMTRGIDVSGGCSEGWGAAHAGPAGDAALLLATIPRPAPCPPRPAYAPRHPVSPCHSAPTRRHEAGRKL